MSFSSSRYNTYVYVNDLPVTPSIGFSITKNMTTPTPIGDGTPVLIFVPLVGGKWAVTCNFVVTVNDGTTVFQNTATGISIEGSLTPYFNTTTFAGFSPATLEDTIISTSTILEITEPNQQCELEFVLQFSGNTQPVDLTYYISFVKLV